MVLKASVYRSEKSRGPEMELVHLLMASGMEAPDCGV
jgi:hypothetical protein